MLYGIEGFYTFIENYFTFLSVFILEQSEDITYVKRIVTRAGLRSIATNKDSLPKEAHNRCLCKTRSAAKRESLSDRFRDQLYVIKRRAAC